MFHEGRDLEKLFGQIGAPKGFPEKFSGFAGEGRSLKGKPRSSSSGPSAPSSPRVSPSSLSGAALFKFLGISKPFSLTKEEFSSPANKSLRRKLGKVKAGGF